MAWRNDHWYRAEPLEFRRLRHRDNIDLNHAAADETLPSDYADRFDPATDQWPTELRSPVPVLAGSCSTDTAPRPHPRDAATTSVAGRPGGTSLPATHPPRKEAA